MVSHAGSVRVFAARMLRVDRASVLQWPLAFGGIAQLRCFDTAWALVRWNAYRVGHVVSHDGCVRVLAAHLLRVDRASALQWPLAFGGIVQLRPFGTAWALVRWNA
ncbi:hypothetical protein BURKHO8Y_140517 [Burkholderia sp. 8Y]|uniref:histidine phosphatase family protein n=1 Tax=Burkholderia sp. 8Y TaxID=2653133 RepID=UPI0012F02EE3|nr:histidine phosphatase family protein [Burkholderia sp. 8Y]VXB64575.1 hypothetical protein BURKHO8Y_140517 [Burkholderia sp. 8Y]